MLMSNLFVCSVQRFATDCVVSTHAATHACACAFLKNLRNDQRALDVRTLYYILPEHLHTNVARQLAYRRQQGIWHVAQQRLWIFGVFDNKVCGF